jgi:hypothetical protein
MILPSKSESEIFDEVHSLSVKQFRRKISSLNFFIRLYTRTINTLKTTDSYPYSIPVGHNINNKEDAQKLIETLNVSLTAKKHNLDLITKMFEENEFFK